MIKEATLDLNRKIMTDNVWLHVFGEKIDHRSRSVFDAFIIAKAHSKTNVVNAMPIKAAVCMINDVARPVADKIIKHAIDENHLKKHKDENNETKHVYTLGAGMYETLNEVYELQNLVLQVVEAQRLAPDNYQAGAELVPETIYFNLFDPAKIDGLSKAVDNKIYRMKNGKNSKKPANNNVKGEKDAA